MDLVLAARREGHARTLSQRRDRGAAATARARGRRIGALSGAGIRRNRRGFSLSTVGRFARGLDRASVLLVGWSILERRVSGCPCAASWHGGVRNARHGR